MGLPRVSLGGVQVRMRQSLFTFRHRTFKGEPGTPGFSAAASGTQDGAGCGKTVRAALPVNVHLATKPLPFPPIIPLLANPSGVQLILKTKTKTACSFK